MFTKLHYTQLSVIALSLRKLAHAMYRDFLALKIENVIEKNNVIFNDFAPNIDCGLLEYPRQGGSKRVLTIGCFGTKIRK